MTGSGASTRTATTTRSEDSTATNRTKSASLELEGKHEPSRRQCEAGGSLFIQPLACSAIAILLLSKAMPLLFGGKGERKWRKLRRSVKCSTECWAVRASESRRSESAVGISG